MLKRGRGLFPVRPRQSVVAVGVVVGKPYMSGGRFGYEVKINRHILYENFDLIRFFGKKTLSLTDFGPFEIRRLEILF